MDEACLWAQGIYHLVQHSTHRVWCRLFAVLRTARTEALADEREVEVSLPVHAPTLPGALAASPLPPRHEKATHETKMAPSTVSTMTQASSRPCTPTSPPTDMTAMSQPVPAVKRAPNRKTPRKHDTPTVSPSKRKRAQLDETSPAHVHVHADNTDHVGEPASKARRRAPPKRGAPTSRLPRPRRERRDAAASAPAGTPRALRPRRAAALS